MSKHNEWWAAEKHVRECSGNLAFIKEVYAFRKPHNAFEVGARARYLALLETRLAEAKAILAALGSPD